MFRFKSDGSAVYERVWKAIDVLATSPEPLQKRLFYAGMELAPLRRQDFPDFLQADYRYVMDALTAKKDKANKGALCATTGQLTDSQATDIARSLWGLYSDLVDHICGED